MSVLNHSFTINRIRTYCSPVLEHYRNQFDELGALVGVHRLEGEHNYLYKRRILDSFVNISNSSYSGLINGINRDLGLGLYDSISINPKKNNSGDFIATDPLIVFDENWLLLYSDFANNVLDSSFDRNVAGGDYEHLGTLVAAINATSLFEATLLDAERYFEKSSRIINQTNKQTITVEFTPTSTRFKLKNSNIVKNSVYFWNREDFRTEVSTEEEVNSRGKYFINYTKGIIVSYTTPTNKNIVRYSYLTYPFISKSSPIIIHNFNSQSFQSTLFSQITDYLNNTTYNGILTERGVDLLNELISLTPFYWGE